MVTLLTSSLFLFSFIDKKSNLGVGPLDRRHFYMVRERPAWGRAGCFMEKKSSDTLEIQSNNNGGLAFFPHKI
jgi:hypothetical protein